ncbi:MAG: quercetin dioxygenase-like cupin family protein [Gammaproteobacteria bacterium]|jgi:quercetin dioxygenase-like cupin family protein
MKKINTDIAFKDDRGEISDLIENEEINAITRISFNSGAIRANHYHKETTQWNYVLSGDIRLVTKLPNEIPVEIVMYEGDLYVTEPNESHALQCLSDNALLLVFTKGPRAGKEYESDTFHLDIPLI